MCRKRKRKRRSGEGIKPEKRRAFTPRHSGAPGNTSKIQKTQHGDTVALQAAEPPRPQPTPP